MSDETVKKPQAWVGADGVVRDPPGYANQNGTTSQEPDCDVENCSGCVAVDCALSSVEDKFTAKALDMITYPPLDKKTRNELQAMTTLANSLSVLDQKQRDRVIRWVCELFELSNPSEEFDEELEFDKKRQVTPSSIKDARRLLRDALVECPGYKASWRNDVSSLIAQDLAALMNPISLSMDVRDGMSEKIIHHLFYVED